jgi:hypothetical protein
VNAFGEFPLGFGPVMIEGKATETLKGQCTIKATCSRMLLVPSSIADDFQIVDMKVNGRSQRKALKMWGGHNLKATRFTEMAAVPIRHQEALEAFAAIPKDAIITLTIRNRSRHLKTFSGAMFVRPVMGPTITLLDGRNVRVPS